MTIREAFSNVKQVCESYRGTWQEHQAIQQSLKVIAEELNRKKESKEDTDI